LKTSNNLFHLEALAAYMAYYDRSKGAEWMELTQSPMAKFYERGNEIYISIQALYF
jgi:hypothetical protein